MLASVQIEKNIVKIITEKIEQKIKTKKEEKQMP